jgi:hypothetical protein
MVKAFLFLSSKVLYKFLVVLGREPRALHMLGKCFAVELPLPIPPPPPEKVVLNLGNRGGYSRQDSHLNAFFHPSIHANSTVVLSQGHFCPPVNVWRHFWVSQMEWEGANLIWVETRGTAKHPTMHKTGSTAKDFPVPMSTVRRWRNPDLHLLPTSWLRSFFPSGRNPQ